MKDRTTRVKDRTTRVKDRTTTPPVLDVRDVTVRFAGLTALDSVSFTVAPGTVHALIGPNGAGKSTCFNVLSGLYRPASGTVTLEVAYHATPMLVMYNTNRWTYRLIGQFLITTPYFSIPNILAQREIVPEFMPYYLSTDPITARAVEWLTSPSALAKVRRDLQETIRPLIKPGAAVNTARELDAMIRTKTEKL